MKVLSLADGHMENFSYKEKKRYSIGCNTITSFLYDKGIWWIGTQFGGLNYTPLVGEKFSYYDWKDFYSTDYNIRSFCQLKSGNKLIGTRTGLFYISEKENRIKKFISEDESSPLRSDIILCIKELSNNSILISTYGGGVYLFDENSLTLKDFSKEEPLLYGCFFQFAEDQEGNLWFASTDGVYRCSMQGKLLKKYDVSNSGLTNNTVFYVYPDSIGRLWIGTYSGLFLMDIETGKIRSDCFSSPIQSTVKYIMEDSKNNIWICSENGLYKINQDLTINKHYTKGDILPDNIVLSILEDKQGNFWITTLKEIVKFDSTESIHYTYRRMDGLIGTDFNNNVYQLDSNIIWWANEGGLIYTSEDDTNVDVKSVKHPIVSSYLIDKMEYDPTFRNQSEAITLYKDNTLCFKFSNLDYSLPYANYYEYKLEGYDKDWVKQTGVNEVIYYNLPSGKYVFKIRASENSEPAQQWSVSVHKSYFTFVMILLVIVVIGALMVYFYGKIRSLQKRMKEERLILGSVVRQQNKAKEIQATLPEEKVGDIMDELLDYMKREKPYLNSKLSISEVASQLGCTELELSQLLNSHMKVNFANFINVYRVKEIKLRLTQENLSKYTLKALSEQCGFNSKTTFYRVFKNVTGMPPMEYCKKLNLVVDENGE
ncbi:MAG: two-component regulator propeller domain-containing protein [Bacteroides xylanisolvens]|nr:two-component regulator propeller domain-containing protein [Bacteroides xylanisolvens]